MTTSRRGLPFAPLLLSLLLLPTPCRPSRGRQQAPGRRDAATMNDESGPNETMTHNATEIGTFLWFSDFHLDPLYGREGAFNGYGLGKSCSVTPSNASAAARDASRGRYGCDSPPGLVGGAIAAASELLALSSRPDFVLVTGDLSRHGSDEYFEDENEDPLVGLSSILTRVSTLLNASFGDIADESDGNGHHHRGGGVIPCVGNNDVTPDYYLDLEDANNTVLNIIADAFVDSGLVPPDSEEERTLRIGGYLSRTVHSRLTVLSVNTVPYLTNHEPAGQTPRIIDPYGQFDWLRDQLRMARNASRSVYLTGHIPPTIGSYRHSQYWKGPYLDRYRDILGEFSDVVAGQLFGHLHSDEFRVLDGWDDDLPPVLLAGSVTPVFRSNPTFRVVTHRYRSAAGGGGVGNVTEEASANGGGGGGNILDYETYYLGLGAGDDGGGGGGGANITAPSWTSLYSFAESYGVPDLSSSSLRRIVRSMGGGVVGAGGGPPHGDDGGNGGGDVDGATTTTMTADDAFGKFLTYLHGGASSSYPGATAASCDASCRAEWVCTLTSATRDEYDSCLPSWYHHRAGGSSSSARAAMVVVTLSILCTVGLLFVGLAWYRRRHSVRSMYEAHTDEVAMEVVEGRGRGPGGSHGLDGDDDDGRASSVVGAEEGGGGRGGDGGVVGGVHLPAIS